MFYLCNPGSRAAARSPLTGIRLELRRRQVVDPAVYTGGALPLDPPFDIILPEPGDPPAGAKAPHDSGDDSQNGNDSEDGDDRPDRSPAVVCGVGWLVDHRRRRSRWQRLLLERHRPPKKKGGKTNEKNWLF